MGFAVIDMRGFIVDYKGQTYSCLQLYRYTDRECIIGNLRYCNVDKLKVSVIAPCGTFETLDDVYWEFTFHKED
jgi:hypothetical protein